MPEGFSELPAKVRQILLNRGNAIQSVEGRIQTDLITAGRIEKRSGYYWAESSGRFRINYFRSDETVVFNGEKLYWYIPENGFTWVMQSQQKAMKPAVPGQKKPGWLSSDFRIEPDDNWLQRLINADLYSYRIYRDNSDVAAYAVTVDLAYRAVVERITYDRSGREFMIEKLSEPVFYRDTPFFRKVSIRAGRQRGLTNMTVYSELVFNRKRDDSFFRKPPGPYREYRP